MIVELDALAVELADQTAAMPEHAHLNAPECRPWLLEWARAEVRAEWARVQAQGADEPVLVAVLLAEMLAEALRVELGLPPLGGVR